jgi:methionyl-tRNA formyltransferase
MNLKDLKVIFMGTPEFAVPTLKALAEHCNVVSVVTVADKEQGRGRKIQASPVKEEALELGIRCHQPLSLKDPDFIETIKCEDADIICVVAFRILPEAVYTLAKIASFNIHGSLLPKYRGAAPINHAIINGECKTGLTSFILKKQVDTGDILLRFETELDPDTRAGELHDKLMMEAPKLAIQTCELLASGNYTPLQQDESVACPAPKIFRETCKIDLTMPAQKLRNFIHGLSPHPGAWALLDAKTFKILHVRITDEKSESANVGKLEFEKSSLKLNTIDYKLEILEVQAEGKRAMSAKDFLSGWRGEKLVQIT